MTARFVKSPRSGTHAEGARRPRRLARFCRDRRGVTAIEFGLVAAPFFALLFAILETALVFLSTQLFETSVSDASRLVRTGRAQGELNLDMETFKTAICERVIIVSQNRCEADMRLRVEIFPTFAAAAAPPPPIVLDEEGELSIEERYEPGAGSEIVVVRMYYVWDLIVPSFGLSLNDIAPGKRLISAAATFRNEPF